MKLETAALLAKANVLIAFVKRYGVFLFIVVFLSLYVFLVQRIGQLINSEVPMQATSESATKTISRLKVDKDSAEHMKQLESQNVEIQSLFNEARQNPFAE